MYNMNHQVFEHKLWEIASFRLQSFGMEGEGAFSKLEINARRRKSDRRLFLNEVFRGGWLAFACLPHTTYTAYQLVNNDVGGSARA